MVAILLVGVAYSCIQLGIHVAPLEVIYKLYHLKVKDSIKDMLGIILEIPLDIRGCTAFPEDELQVNEAGIDKYLHTEYGLLVDFDIFESGEVYPLLRSQVGKDFYIPSAAQIEEITHDCYESSSLAYKKLHTFFMKKLHMENELATTWCLNVWMNSYNGDSPTEIINDLNEHDVVFDGEDQLGEFINLLMDAHNNTRLIENRGHKPVELHANNFTGVPTIVPESSKVASILWELQPNYLPWVFLWNWARRFILMLHVHVVLEKSIRSVVGDKKFIVTNIEVIFA